LDDGVGSFRRVNLVAVKRSRLGRKGPSPPQRVIIGCDFHTRYQQIAMMDEATGELVERRLDHQSSEARAFYRGLPKPVRVGIQATPGRPSGVFHLRLLPMGK